MPSRKKAFQEDRPEREIPAEKLPEVHELKAILRETDSDRAEDIPSIPVMPETVGTGAMRKRSRGMAWKIVGGVVILLILTVGTFGVGVYMLGWQGAWVDKITDSTSLPVAFADNKPITFKDYHSDVETLRYYFKNNPLATEGSAEPTDSEIVVTVLNRLVYDSVLRDLVKQYNITVSNEEIEQQMQSIADSRGSREDVGSLLSELYGWNEDQFKEKILTPYLWLTKLEEKLTQDGVLNQDASQKADEIYAKVKAGEKSFEELAKEFSEDTTASVGGDLGFFGKGEMVPEFEAALEALEIGATSEIVQTQFGYHIIKLEEKVGEGEDLKYRARHILIRTKQIDEYVNDRIAEASVRVFLPGYTWDNDQNWITQKGVQG